SVPNAERIFYLGHAFEAGLTVEEVFELTKIDRWFLENIRQIVDERTSWEPIGFGPTVCAALNDRKVAGLLGAQIAQGFRTAKKLGFSDRQIAVASRATDTQVRELRKANG